MSDIDHHQYGDENGNGNGTGNMTKNSSSSSNDIDVKPTFRLSRYRYHSSSSSNTNNSFKSSSSSPLKSTSTSTTTVKTKTKNIGGGLAGVNRSSRKHHQHHHSTSKDSSYLRLSDHQTTQIIINNKSRADGSTRSRNSNSSRNRGRKRDLNDDRRIGIQSPEKNANENGEEGGDKDSRSSTSFLFGEDEVDNSDTGRRFGDSDDNGIIINGNTSNNKSTGRRRRRSRSEVLASIVGSALNNTKNREHPLAGDDTRRSHRRSNNGSTKSETTEHSKNNVGGKRRGEGERVMKKRIRLIASSSSPSFPYDKDGENNDDDDDELRRLEQAFFDDMDDDENRLRNVKTSSDTNAKTVSNSNTYQKRTKDAAPNSDNEPRRSATRLQLDDSSDEDCHDDESDFRDGELRQNATTNLPPTITRNGPDAKNGNDVESNEQRWLSSVNVNENRNKTPSFPVDTSASETSENMTDVDLDIARQDHHLQHPTKNKKIDLLEREVDNLFIRSDQRTSTVKTFTKSLEARIGKKLSKDEKKKVKDRLVSLVNQVFVPRPATTTTTTTVPSMNNKNFKFMDDDVDDCAGEEVTNPGISKQKIETANHRTRTAVEATSHRTEDSSTKHLTDRDGKGVEQRRASVAIGSSTTYHTGSIQSRSISTTMHQRSSEELAIASEGQSTGRKSTDGECLHGENRSSRSGKSASISPSDDPMDKNVGADSSSGGPLEDSSTGINENSTLPDPDVSTAENGPRQNEEISVMIKPKRRKRKQYDNKNDTTLPTESATETRAEPKRQTKNVSSKHRDVEIIDVDKAKSLGEGVVAASKDASKANNQTKNVSEKTEPVPRPKKRARTKSCALCKTCPCQKTPTGQDHAVTLNMSSTFSRSDTAVEKALIRRLQKLEKSVEHTAEQMEMVRRNLKKHRRDIWKRKEKETSMDGRSGWSASAIVPIGEGGKAQTYAASGFDEEAWFLPDAKIFEQQQTNSVKTNGGLVKKAQLMLYKTVPCKLHKSPS